MNNTTTSRPHADDSGTRNDPAAICSLATTWMARSVNLKGWYHQFKFPVRMKKTTHYTARVLVGWEWKLVRLRSAKQVNKSHTIASRFGSNWEACNPAGAWGWICISFRSRWSRSPMRMGTNGSLCAFTNQFIGLKTHYVNMGRYRGWHWKRTWTTTWPQEKCLLTLVKKVELQHNLTCGLPLTVCSGTFLECKRCEES